MFNRRYAYRESKISPKTAPNLRLQWKFYAGKDITATPAIYDGTLYFPSWNGNIYAVREADGSLVWKQNLEKLTGFNATGFVLNVNWTVSRSTPTVVSEDLLITGIYGPAAVIGLKRTTGEMLWLTTLDNHPAAIITMSGSHYNGSVQNTPPGHLYLIFFHRNCHRHAYCLYIYPFSPILIYFYLFMYFTGLF